MPFAFDKANIDIRPSLARSLEQRFSWGAPRKDAKTGKTPRDTRDPQTKAANGKDMNALLHTQPAYFCRLASWNPVRTDADGVPLLDELTGEPMKNDTVVAARRILEENEYRLQVFAAIADCDETADPFNGRYTMFEDFQHDPARFIRRYHNAMEGTDEEVPYYDQVIYWACNEHPEWVKLYQWYQSEHGSFIADLDGAAAKQKAGKTRKSDSYQSA